MRATKTVVADDEATEGKKKKKKKRKGARGGGEMASGGILRSNMRVEIRTTGAAMWVADAYTHIDGQEVLVQSYRFTR